MGVLALPRAVVGTGPAGFALLLYFTANAMFAGARLGDCWVMVTERFPEFRDGVRHVSRVTCHVLTFAVSVSIHGHSGQSCWGVGPVGSSGLYLDVKL